MEAPAKPGGTRKSGQKRDLIGRLSALPPIEFLKRYNPLRRRTRRVQLGFDQPLQEIKRLALPLRPAPPSLSSRLFARLRAAATRIAARITAIGRSAQAIALTLLRKAALPARRAWDRLSPAFGAMASTVRATSSRVIDIRHSRAVGWLEQRVEAIARRAAALEPAPWQASQTAALMLRTRRVRRVLAGTVVCQWTALAGLLTMLAALAIAGHTWDRASIHACGLILAAVGLSALTLQAWHHRLIRAWQDMELFICSRCGGLRNFSPSLACPSCGTDDAPAFPGQVPAHWRHWPALVSPLAAGAPALLAAMLLFLARTV